MQEGYYYLQALILSVPEEMILMKMVIESIALEELIINSHRFKT